MVKLPDGLFTSASEHWETPEELRAELDAEFHFNDDPCPQHGLEFGLTRSWGTRTFCNPPWSRPKPIRPWLEKGLAESLEGKVVVMLIPSRTDTRWWHEVVMKADEIRFLKGRLKFSGAKHGAPFPSAVVVFKGATC